MKFLALILACALAVPASVAGQEPPAPPPDRPAAEPGARKAPSPAAELPVSIERIRRKLALAPPSKTAGLKLEYYVEVYGKSPHIDLFTDFDPTTGAVQYGSPTHQEFLTLVTPEEFKSPPADLLTPAVALIKWLAEKGKAKQANPPR